MKHKKPFTPADRDRSIARLRQLTIGSAVSSVAAVAMFGFAAAATAPGIQAEDVTLADQAATVDSTLSGSAAAGYAAEDASGTTTEAEAAATPTATDPALQATTTTPTTTRRRSRSTSSGSGH